MNQRRIIHAAPVASITPFLNDGELVALDVGPDGVVYLVIARTQSPRREIAAGGASFARSVAIELQRYRIIGLSGSKCVLDVEIEGERFHIDHLQPLGTELLLVSARSSYRSKTDFDRNGRIYSLDGKFEREILLGDGIQSVQTTEDGTIWTSYFDEGIFGNRGWPRPVAGGSGLVAWSRDGQMQYEYQSEHLDTICDCYALNVQSERNVWLYYYTDFPLVHLHDRKIKGAWSMPIKGSSAFAIHGPHALFRGGYDRPHTYELFQLRSGDAASSLAVFELEDSAGRKLNPQRVVGRGGALYLLADDNIYVIGVGDALSIVCSTT